MKNNSNELPKFDRMIPKDGIVIYPDILYRDANDMPKDMRIKYKKFFAIEDPAYHALRLRAVYLNRGKKIGRKFNIYSFKNGDLIGLIRYTEYLDNPDGYGKDDFLLVKLIMPLYRGTKYSRYASSDLTHMLLWSKIANNIYSYLPIKTTGGDDYWKNLDPDLPCVGKVFSTDSKEVQKYIIKKKEIKTSVGWYMLSEMNGDIYRSMDLKAYMMAPPGRTEKVVDRWILEMDEAAKIIRETVRGKSSR